MELFRIFSIRLLEIFTIGVLASCQPAVRAAAPGLGAPVEGVTVVGQGKASGQPDIARAQVGIEVRAATAEQATQELNTRMAALLLAIKQTGVLPKDVRTTNFSIHFEQVPERPPTPVPLAAPAVAPPRPPPPRAPGPSEPPVEPPIKLPQGHYRASNMVEVTIRDLNRAPEVLTAATRSGANQIFGIEFEIEDPSALEAKAREKAMADARARAEKLAALAGVTLGRVLSVSETPGRALFQPGYGMQAKDAAMASVAVERGELSVQLNVQVVYALPEARK